jgi:hypothetical protein
MVPVDVALPEGTHTLIVSGPNAGGKTIVLKTTGLLALMAHAGMWVRPRSAPPLSSACSWTSATGKSIEGSLSTFSAHIQNLAAIASSIEPPCLVLIDEIGTGPIPVEGGALAIALLEHLRAHGALTIATTHHGPGEGLRDRDDGRRERVGRVRRSDAGADLRPAAGNRREPRPGWPSPRGSGSTRRSSRTRARGSLPPTARARTYLSRLRELLGALEADRRELESYRARLEDEARRAREEAIRSDHERAERYRGELAKALEEFREGARKAGRPRRQARDDPARQGARAPRGGDPPRVRAALARGRDADEPGTGKKGSGAVRSGACGAGGAGAGAEALLTGRRGGGPRGPYGREGRIESIDGDRATGPRGSARFQVRVDDCLPPGSAVSEGPARWKTARGPSAGDRPRATWGARPLRSRSI